MEGRKDKKQQGKKEGDRNNKEREEWTIREKIERGEDV